MSQTSTPRIEEDQAPSVRQPSRWQRALREISSSSVTVSVLAVVLALAVGAMLIILTDPAVQQSATYFIADPVATLRAAWDAVTGAYMALFQGAIYNTRATDPLVGLRPLTESLTFATPLIVAGLGVAVAFRAGMFNIGGRGQILVAAAAAGWVGFAVPLPPGIHGLVAVVAGIAAGTAWGGIAGLLKAKTGAHEVITTIMLNFIALYLVTYMLRTPGLLQAPGSNNPKTPPMAETAILPGLLGPQYNLHLGFVMSLVAVAAVWWLIERSSLGFQFRAVGINPHAARVAGVNVNRIYLYAMLLSGGLVGMAGVNQVLGTVTTGFSTGIDANIGFDAITVALLGRSRPLGVLAAGLLFGGFKAGGFAMQASEGVPIDIVLVLQSLIVLLIAAPPLVRAIFRLPSPSPSHSNGNAA
ncbi:MAG TPA: ABC transporter permease [Gemmatimonadetes bacterium]|nr:ABC transporter permease [Gemmatimonadota bacterium]|tara:strand:- start:12168 stop:13409 length:1242 start_codon:yes stop_codon:yes gene_type:complete